MLKINQFSETWLDASNTNLSINIEGYNVLRRDRISHAGGVCAYIRSDLSYNQRAELQNDGLEDLWMELLLPNSKPIFIGTCYRAPDNNKIIDCLESTMSKLRIDCNTIILGKGINSNQVTEGEEFESNQLEY